MATSKIKTTTIEEAQITTTHTLRYGLGKAYKYGKVVFLTVNMVLTSDVTAYDSVIGTLSSGFIPCRLVYISAADTGIGLQISSSTGEIQAESNISSGTVLAFSACYVI